MKEAEMMAAGSLGLSRVVHFLEEPNSEEITERDLTAAKLGLGVVSTAVRNFSAHTNRKAVELAARRFSQQVPTGSSAPAEG